MELKRCRNGVKEGEISSHVCVVLLWNLREGVDDDDNKWY